MPISPEDAIAQSSIDSAVKAAYPDYTAVVIGARNLEPGASCGHSEALLHRAEAWASELLEGREPQDLPQIAAWRAAYLSFGVKPREGRSSVEALIRRAGLPRIDRLTDIYNAISVLHLTPIGGEDLNGYEGPARLVLADGTEEFDTVADGEQVIQTPTPGEVIWRDDRGVTCRRWNWRQCVRTRLSDQTTQALFIIDGLGPDSRENAEVTAAELMTELRVDSPKAEFSIRTLA